LWPSAGCDRVDWIPATAAGIAHLETMFRTTARRLTADELQLMMKSTVGSH
jgi:hypothetical protein